MVLLLEQIGSILRQSKPAADMGLDRLIATPGPSRSERGRLAVVKMTRRTEMVSGEWKMCLENGNGVM